MDALIVFPSLLATTLTSFFVILVTILYVTFVKKDARVVKLVGQFPGPPLKPIVGNVMELAVPSCELIPIFVNWAGIYGGCYRIWFANQAYVVFSDAKSVEKILSTNANIEKSIDYDYLQGWLGTGLLTSRGAKWTSRRKLLTPAFHFKILDDFLEVFNEQADTLVKVLSSNCNDGAIINIFPYITRCALDIICETAMGKKINAQSQSEGDSDYVRAIYSIGDLVLTRFVRPWLGPNLIWNLSSYGRGEKKLLKILHEFTNKVIEERKLDWRQRQSINQSEGKSSTQESGKDDDMFMTKKRRLAFLDLLLDVAEDGKVLSDSDIREETDTFMFEGHDTTAANLSWTLFLLASNPECQERVRQELDGIFGEDWNREITTNDLAQMKYLELCIKESLRIFPSVPFIARRIEKDIHLDDNKIAPAGSQAFIVPYLLHRDPTVFPDPEKFIPERFLSENKRHPYAYVPFSAGPRNCIGQKFAIMEEKVVLAKVLMNFTMEAAEDVKDIVLLPDLILRPRDGLKLKLKKRLRG